MALHTRPIKTSTLITMLCLGSFSLQLQAYNPQGDSQHSIQPSDSTLPLTDAKEQNNQQDKRRPQQEGESMLEQGVVSSVVATKKSKAAQRIEYLEAWQDSGKQVYSSLNQDEITALSNSITAATYEATLKDLVDAAGGSRYVGSPGNGKAVDYLSQQYAAAGLTVKLHPLTWGQGSSSFLSLQRSNQTVQPKFKLFNVAGFKKGTDLAHEVVLLGAHFDSINSRDSHTDGSAPGVDDNGSGSALVLSIANALKNHQSRRSLLVVGFNAEEEGLHGSSDFANDVVKEQKEYGKIMAAIVADEVSFAGRPQFARRAIFETEGSMPETRAVVDTMAHSVDDDISQISGFEENPKPFGSDHIPLLRVGVPTVLLIERDDEWHADNFAHSSQDTFKGLSMDYGAAMTRLAMRSLLKLLNPQQA